MARPKFYAKHFVACQNAGWDGPAGPDTARTLEGVNFLWDVPSDTEFPFEMAEFWLYARLVRTGPTVGERELKLELWWHDSPDGLIRLAARPLGPVRFTTERPVVNRAWVMRPLQFPGEGLFEFRLLTNRRRSWVTHVRQVANEYIRLRRAS
jgi:hypothetical protein